MQKQQKQTSRKATKAGKSKAKKSNARERRLERRILARGIVGNNPGLRENSYLNLTHNQWNASSPQSLWEFKRASTPGGIRVKGREMIASLAPAAANATGSDQVLEFVQGIIPVNAFLINPISFPRLQAIGSVFEEFYFHSARFTYQPNFSTVTNGQVCLCVDYEAKDVPPASFEEQLSNASASVASVYSDQSLLMTGELSRLRRYWYSSEDASTTDTNQMIQAKVIARCQGRPTLEGEFYGIVMCEYDVEFFTPCMIDETTGLLKQKLEAYSKLNALGRKGNALMSKVNVKAVASDPQVAEKSVEKQTGLGTEIPCVLSCCKRTEQPPSC